MSDIAVVQGGDKRFIQGWVFWEQKIRKRKKRLCQCRSVRLVRSYVVGNMRERNESK